MDAVDQDGIGVIGCAVHLMCLLCLLSTCAGRVARLLETGEISIGFEEGLKCD